MEEKIKVCLDVCGECGGIGARLGQNGIVQIAEAACRNIQRSGKLRIVFAALQPKSLLDTAEEAVNAAVLPQEMSVLDICSSFDLILTYGEGEEEKDFWQLQEQADLPAVLTRQRRADILKEADVELLYSSRSFTDFDWKTRLAETDYLFLVIDAASPLSASEREFAELYVKKYLGASRFALVVANSTVINTPEDYKALYDRIGWFLASVGENSRSFEAGEGTLAAFLSGELAEGEKQLREMAAAQITQVCAEETREAVQALQKLTLMDGEKLEEIIGELERRKEKMVRMGDVAASKAYSEITGNIRYACNKAIDDYVCQLEENIAQTVRETDDLEEAASLLPRFLLSASEQGTDQLQEFIRTELTGLEARLKQDMIRDAGEFFCEIPMDIPMDAPLGHPGHSDYAGFQADAGGSETQKKLNLYSRALLIGAIPAAVLGYLPLAVGTVIGSQLVRRFSKEKIQRENREALLGQIHSFCQTLQSELQEKAARFLGQLADSAEEKVKKGYEQFIASSMNTLAGKREQISQAADMREAIAEVLNQQLPALEERL